MKYDECGVVEPTAVPNENVIRKTRKRAKINLLDVFIIQAAICVAISCGIMISRFVGLGL